MTIPNPNESLGSIRLVERYLYILHYLFVCMLVVHVWRRIFENDKDDATVDSNWQGPSRVLLKF